MWSLDGVTYRGLGRACLLSPTGTRSDEASIHVDTRFVAIKKTSQSHLRAAVLIRKNCFLTLSVTTPPAQQIFIYIMNRKLLNKIHLNRFAPQKIKFVPGSMPPAPSKFPKKEFVLPKG
jgi:hypothetical protein